MKLVSQIFSPKENGKCARACVGPIFFLDRSLAGGIIFAYQMAKRSAFSAREVAERERVHAQKRKQGKQVKDIMHMWVGKAKQRRGGQRGE